MFNYLLQVCVIMLQRRIQAMEMRCYLKIQRISYKDRVTDEEVRAKIQQAIGPHEDLLTTVKRRKLQWCGHVSRSSGLAKTILQGTAKGGKDKADRGRGGKTTSGNRQAWSLPSPRGQWRTRKNGGNWLRNHLWCSNDHRGWGIDEMRVILLWFCCRLRCEDMPGEWHVVRSLPGGSERVSGQMGGMDRLHHLHW